jgi:hypothetical protein
VSQFHLDAAGGIQALREAAVPVVASTETARLLRERGPEMQTEISVTSATPTLPATLPPWIASPRSVRRSWCPATVIASIRRSSATRERWPKPPSRDAVSSRPW